MRRNGWLRLSLAACLAASVAPIPAQAASTCEVVTVGASRPDWFCEFYADGPVEYVAASASGWAIDRLLYQQNDGKLVFERLASMPASDGSMPPLDVATGTLDDVQEGWRIRIQILASNVRTLLPPPNDVFEYRDGFIRATS